MDLLDRMLEHDRWITARLLGACLDLSDEQLDQTFDIGRRSIRETFEHMIIDALEYWTACVSGMPFDRERDGTSPIAALIERHERSYEAFEHLARQMRDEKRLNDRLIDRYGIAHEIGATIIQVPLHNHQHRSEILHMLKRLGATNLPEGDPQEWEHSCRRYDDST